MGVVQNLFARITGLRDAVAKRLKNYPASQAPSRYLGGGLSIGMVLKFDR